MQVTAKLNNLRMAPRKVRLVASLVKGRDVGSAKTELSFMPKKTAGIILKLLNSAAASAKHNFNLEESNLYILKLIVDAGPSLKRWMPRAMGRAAPILKRTSNVSLILEEREPGMVKMAKKQKSGQAEKPETEKLAALPDTAETISAVSETKLSKQKPVFVDKPYGAQQQGRKKFFSRQTFGGIKRMFRRKSI